MWNACLKKSVPCVTLAAFMTLNAAPSHAQSFSLSVFPELSLVAIKAVDAPALHTENGKTGMASCERYGHGIIIDPSGIIVTSTHIIAAARHIYVALTGGKTFEATVLYTSKADFSFIKINAHSLLKAIAWGDSSGVQVGNPVVALANSKSTLGGEITSLIKDTPSGNVELLELKLNLKPGDSGGPILNEQGCLLGLIMANRKSDNSKSYAIASNKIQQEYFKYKGSVLIGTNALL